MNEYAGSELEKFCKDRAFVLRYDTWQHTIPTAPCCYLVAPGEDAHLRNDSDCS